MTADLGWQLVIELLILGTVTGLLAGLLGIGGGALVVPFMAMLFEAKGMPREYILKMAVATSLASIMFTSMSSVRAHHQRGAVLWRLVALLSPGIVIGSILGAQIAKAMPTMALTLVFAFFVAYSATQMLRGKAPESERALPGRAAMLGAGGAIGVASSLVGVGGAFMSVPFMTWHGVKIHNSVATSAALGFPIALAGALGYVIAGWNVPDLPAHTLGFVYLPALFALSAASVLTAPLGARAAHRLDIKQLRRAFAVLLYALSAYMLYKAIQLAG